MEGGSKMETPCSDKTRAIWSPEALTRNHPHSSTPYWPPLRNHNDSEGSSKQDSGYISATPKSADSGGLFSDKCRLCNKSLHHSYGLSTPEFICSCRRPNTNGISPNEYMEEIKEVKISPTPKLSSRVRIGRRDLGMFEDAMDASLYPEEMEVDSFSSKDDHQCSMDLLEFGEEKSIDFMEPDVFSSTSQNSAKETPSLSLPSKLLPDDTELGAVPLKDEEEKGCANISSEVFFSPELFHCDRPSPKITNEVTPTKLKLMTPPIKQNKGSYFQTSAKKVATMNKVVRSFFSLNGLESIDFFYQLGVKKNIPCVISKILKYLPEKDLDSVRMVSKTWNNLLFNDYDALCRWKIYTNTMQRMKENMSSPVKQGGSAGRNRAALTRLHNVGNQSSPPPQSFSSSPPVSPGSARFHSYRKAAKALKPNERLLPCPKCRFPSMDHGSPVAQCPRSGCRHRFCVWCSNEVIPDRAHNCPPLYHPRPLYPLTRRNTMHSVGSKSSKRNLRRL